MIRYFGASGHSHVGALAASLEAELRKALADLDRQGQEVVSIDQPSLAATGGGTWGALCAIKYQPKAS